MILFKRLDLIPVKQPFSKFLEDFYLAVSSDLTSFQGNRSKESQSCHF